MVNDSHDSLNLMNLLTKRFMSSFAEDILSVFYLTCLLSSLFSTHFLRLLMCVLFVSQKLDSLSKVYCWTLLFAATDPALSTSRGQSNQVAPGLVIEAFSAVQGDSVPPEINRVSLWLQEDWRTFMVLLVEIYLTVMVYPLLSLFLSRSSLPFWVRLELQTF